MRVGSIFLMVGVAAGILGTNSYSQPNASCLLSQQTNQLSLPTDLPESFSVIVPILGEQLTLQLEKNEVFGEHTRFLVDDGSGKLKEINRGLDRSYLGRVAEHADFTVSAVLSEQGLIASILRPGEENITVEPVLSVPGTHKITLAEAHDNDAIQANVSEESVDLLEAKGISASTAAIVTIPAPTESVEDAASTATLPPERVMDVLEYEIGVEIGSKAFLADSAYNGNLSYAQSIAQGMMGNLDGRYLHSAGVKHRLGTVIIRTNSSTDPLIDSVIEIKTASLEAFRDYWNTNTNEVGNTHDLAVYHVYNAPSGLAWVNSVGGNNRYALSCGRGPTSWAAGTIAHEFGHSWNLGHVDDKSYLYESKPRNNSGSHSAGGEDVFVSVMHGGGSHNIGRIASYEADRVYAARENKRQYGDVNTDPGAIKPFGFEDNFSVFGTAPHVLDVIANDYDCNNDVLDVRILDTVSQLGATISLSEGTGPGGRNELIYKLAAIPSASSDFFHYTVVDATGLTDWGCVYVTYEGNFVIDTADTSYSYDLGPGSSPVASGMTALTPNAYRDVFWSGDDVVAVSRDSIDSYSDDSNRDFISGSGVSVLNHKIGNGVWDISSTMGDYEYERDLMTVKAEGIVLHTDVTAQTNSFAYEYGTVMVTDGELNLEFSDAGGTNDTWVINRLRLNKVGEVIDVDTSATSYDYDIGPMESPVMSGWVGISDGTAGDIYWSGDSVSDYDENPGGSINDVNRDSIYAYGTSILNHKIANGVWDITMNVGESGYSYTNMNFSAEGEVIASNVEAVKDTFPYVRGQVTVTDGELNLEFSHGGGGWAFTRLSLAKVAGIVVVDKTATSYSYDFGPAGSAVERGYELITSVSMGDISWSGEVTDTDRRAADENLSRDFVAGSSSTTLEHAISNGSWQVTVLIGDPSSTRDYISVYAEGEQKFRTGIIAATTAAQSFEFNTHVSDGSLSLKLADDGGVNEWIINGLVLVKLDNPSRPVAESQDVTTTPGQAVDITLVGSDADDGDVLEYIVSARTAGGVVSGTAPNLVYTPNNGFTGTDSFTFQVFDGTVYSERATVTVRVEESGDTDHDDLPDSWERSRFGGLHQLASGDPDGDGFRNIDEYIANTLPDNSNSFLNISSMSRQAEGMVISWESREERSYSVEHFGGLVEAPAMLQDGIMYPQNSYTDAVERAEGFYRIKVSVPNL